MPFGLPILAGAVILGLIWRAKHKSDVVGAGPPGTVVNINPLMGERTATVSLGQTVRINLPPDYIMEAHIGPEGERVDPSTSPLQAFAAPHTGGFTFTAAAQGTVTMTFSKSGSLQLREGRVAPDINVTVTVGPAVSTSGTAATGQWRAYRRPYREFWRAKWTDPTWRWREEQWRTRNVWDANWGQRPPPPETVAPPTTIAPPHEAQTGQHRFYGYGGGYGGGYGRRPYRVWGYRGWWGNRLTDPVWREREMKWRTYRIWDPTWGAQPPIPEQTVTVAVPTPVTVPVATPSPAPAPDMSATAAPTSASDPGY